MHEEISDEQLMERYVRGDRAAFEALFHRWGDRLHRYFVRSVGREVARELVQQTFLQLHRARRDYRTGAPLRPWLYTIAANLRREHFRRMSRRVEQPGAEAADPAVAPSASTAEQRLVRRALAELPDLHREVILLHHYEQLSYPEISVILGASVSAVKVRAHRGYARLREMLGDDV